MTFPWIPFVGVVGEDANNGIKANARQHSIHAHVKSHNMKTKLPLITLLISLLLSCKVQNTTTAAPPNVFNNKPMNKQHEAMISFNLKHEPNLLEEIQSFKRKNKNAALEDQVILDFLTLQMCNQDVAAQFQDYPNALQAIFDFYSAMPKEDMAWLNDQKLKILKFSSVRFIAKHAREMDAMEYLKHQLKDCKQDGDYTKFVISSSDLNECGEKRR